VLGFGGRGLLGGGGRGGGGGGVWYKFTSLQLNVSLHKMYFVTQFLFVVMCLCVLITVVASDRFP